MINGMSADASALVVNSDKKERRQDIICSHFGKRGCTKIGAIVVLDSLQTLNLQKQKERQTKQVPIRLHQRGNQLKNQGVLTQG